MVRYQPPREWQQWVDWLAAGLHGRNRWRLSLIIMGIVFARGRRTVTTWLRAVGISKGFANYYYFLQPLGRKTKTLAERLLSLLWMRIHTGDRVLLAVDDSPTKRHGPQVQGAGIHKNPTPGPAHQKHLYGHIWVTISLVLHHPLWRTIGLPLLGMMYVRAKDIVKIPRKYHWEFKTKLQLAADQVLRFAEAAKKLGNSVWVVADGAYAKWPFLKPLRAAGVVVVSRLRKDARLWNVPVQPTIVETFADRSSIEQDFHDVKEVWGAGQQQVRNIWTNIAVYNLNLWVHTLIECWAWNKTKAEICDRSDSAWDTTERRPSHADRRQGLRREILQNEYLSLSGLHRQSSRIRAMFELLVRLAA